MDKMVQLCITKYSKYANNYDRCQREQCMGCEGCEWYVSETILEMFKWFEKYGFLPDQTLEKRQTYMEDIKS